MTPDPAPSRPVTGQRLRVAGLVAVAAALGALALTVPLPTPEQVREWVLGTGPFAPLAYVAVYVAAALVLVPRPLLSLAGGTLFGAVAGSALAVVGATAAALASFFVARALGRDLVAARLERGALGRVDGLLRRHGWLAVLQLRLLPVVPFSAVNYACGVTSLRPAHFALGTAVGSVPATVLVVLAGASLDDPTSPGFLVPLVLAVVLCAGAALVARRRARDHAATGPGGTGQ
ncbi:putative membrane protein YdjX, TVP38/TMEM64 family, SNARE-associated domain [Streptoalloteichus tenebrarius]|uniref:TVP38/TMEM64 family membrane protein n=1 Tax=Streptoalloteichus tenebrarius (strain ATCC 17920 / DSM 40477 / JCM 4838 / CBS 697.72 / NBRC 16177 / NCIMB 11028 / NRRL B-12390 / A12253. 1 / ISP 5477) TaxID=1933 RepID=A0ABT1HQB9_STRSD|nr:TVP38/TMEM64 family protein [Streptoalloteichus tenebrarius]MCP2257714.1 putative membrane protein YdjX, TVP38/TMEM64 family, SNARE-associated domain [Streptoalloteichus tenebrarius]BFE99932.1 hypothetical protein GCM10020241_16080 [Streptoalloteichus tenebrarius]